MKNLAISADAPPTEISPEGARVANTYLEMGCNIQKTSELLDIPAHEVNSMLNNRYTQGYIAKILTDAGMRSMDKITDSMQELIDRKIEEMQELDMTSSKDAADLLQMLHRMHVEKSKLLLANNPKDLKINNATNQQFNIFNADDNSQYVKLMRAIVEG